MRAILTAVVAAIEGCAAAVAGIAVIGIPAVLLWAVTFNIAADPKDVAAAVAGVWLLAHFVPMELVLSRDTMLSLGVGQDPLTFALTLAPLALTLITVAFALRAGLRLSKRGGVGSAGVLGGTIGFAAVSLAAVTVAGDFNPWPVPAAVAAPAAVYLAAAATSYIVAAAGSGAHWWRLAVRGMQRGLQYLGLHSGVAAFPARAAQALRLAAAALAGVIMVAAMAFATALAVGFADVIALAQALQLDALGSLLLFLVQLVFVPVGVVWSLAWLSGAGFVAGTEFSPFVEGSSPQPMLPMLGALPGDFGSYGLVAPLLLVLVNLGLGVLLAQRSELRRAPWAVALTLPVAAAALVGLLVAGACALASGSMGPGRLDAVGPDPWVAGGLVAAEAAVGLLLGVSAARADYSRVQYALPEPLAKWHSERTQRADQAAQSMRPEDAETVDLSRVRDTLGDDPTDGAPNADSLASENLTAPVVDLFEGVLHARPEEEVIEDAIDDGDDDAGVAARDTAALDTAAFDSAGLAQVDLTPANVDTVALESEAQAFDIELAADTGEMPGAGASQRPAAAGDLVDPEVIERAFAWDAEDSTRVPNLGEDPGVDSGTDSGPGSGKRGRFGLPNWRRPGTKG